MDLLKYPFEKLLYFVAGVIPGFVALLIFQLAAPGSYGWFFSLGFLGYRTKLALIVLACFIVGNTITAFLSALLSAVGGVVATVIALRPYKPPHSYAVAPWRDLRWRTLVKNYLGPEAPNDTHLLSQVILDIRRKMVEYLPEGERVAALEDLDRDKLKTEVNDGEWAQWYEHFHQIILQRGSREFMSYVRTGLYFNLEAAALYVLISATVVPGVRHWWCLLPAGVWLSILTAEVIAAWQRYTNKWLTLLEQLKYLTEEGRGTGHPESVPKD